MICKKPIAYEINSPFISFNHILKMSQTEAKKLTIIACGNCIYCRMQKAGHDITRLLFEMESYPDDEICFITLTKEKEHQKKSNILLKNLNIVKKIPTKGIEQRVIVKRKNGRNVPISGKSGKALELLPEELKKFIKKIRNQNNKLRYFNVGEYGNKYGRPHYHCILFGIGSSFKNDKYQKKRYTDRYREMCRKYKIKYEPPTDLKMLLNECWNYKGNIDIGDCESEQAQYVADHQLKKWNQQSTEQLFGREPEFNRRSRGLGFQGMRIVAGKAAIAYEKKRQSLSKKEREKLDKINGGTKVPYTHKIKLHGKFRYMDRKAKIVFNLALGYTHEEIEIIKTINQKTVMEEYTKEGLNPVLGAIESGKAGRTKIDIQMEKRRHTQNSQKF
ncbi:MAG: rolling circle replication-associated protein [Alphaproteobacteria bacterium]